MKKTCFQFLSTFPAFSRLVWIWPSIAAPCLIHLLKYLPAESTTIAVDWGEEQYLLPNRLGYLWQRCPQGVLGMNQIILHTIHHSVIPRSVGSWLVRHRIHNLSRGPVSPQKIKFSCFQLNLLVKAEKGDLSTFVTNGEWHLLGKI